MIRLRPHHLLCLLTYAGKGYSPAFVANFDALAARLAQEPQWIEVVCGPDAICQPLLASEDHHCTGASVAERDRLAAEDLSSLLGQTIAPGTRFALTPARIEQMRAAFAQEGSGGKGGIRRACSGCQWHGLCDQIAAQNFAQTRLRGGAE